ncbi:aggrecan core protein-like [Oncorhynchus nerka]|uniref:aggrecan core protein-like n=1 Tax=Oncorhynchus nerka TaxID=8023 RepID=UPI0031B8090A
MPLGLQCNSGVHPTGFPAPMLTIPHHAYILEMLLSLLLCAICPLVLPSSSTPSQASDDSRLLQVTIPTTPPLSAVLGGSLTLPCLVSLSHPPPNTNGRHAVLSLPRVKWSVLSQGHETEILVARGDRVKVSEAYKDRASLLHYVSSPADLTLRLDGLQYNDSGFYRCEVQQGLEDADDVAQVKVKGVVFHYRDASSRYAFTFTQARDACEEIGAHIATPEQLLAAYHSGYEQCDAGWLSDHSVSCLRLCGINTLLHRYPIQMPREGCFGDMDGHPGVRNYGLLEHDELYDVYCYVENIEGEVFHGSSPRSFTLWEAKAYCLAQGAELATTGQLYAAWNDGLNACSPGWLADGSVRYPIVTPRERCGGGEPGVRTVYRHLNQTGFPEAHTRHDTYCFRGNSNTHTESPHDYLATEPEDIGQDIVTLSEPLEEFSLGQVTEQVVSKEAQGSLSAILVPEEQHASVHIEEQGAVPGEQYPEQGAVPGEQYPEQRAVPGEQYPEQKAVPGEQYPEQRAVPGEQYPEQRAVPGEQYPEQKAVPGEQYPEQRAVPGEQYPEQRAVPGEQYPEQRAVPGEQYPEQGAVPGEQYPVQVAVPREQYPEQVAVPGEHGEEQGFVPGEHGAEQGAVTEEAYTKEDGEEQGAVPGQHGEEQGVVPGEQYPDQPGEEQGAVDGQGPTVVYHALPFPVEPQDPFTPTSFPQDLEPTEDTWQPVKEVSNPETYQPAPKGANVDLNYPVTPYDELNANPTLYPPSRETNYDSGDLTTAHEDNISSPDPYQPLSESNVESGELSIEGVLGTTLEAPVPTTAYEDVDRSSDPQPIPGTTTESGESQYGISEESHLQTGITQETEHYTFTSETAGYNVSGVEATTSHDSSPEEQLESGLPTPPEEDHSGDEHVIQEHVTDTDSVYPSTSYDLSGGSIRPEGAIAGGVEETSVSSTSPHEETELFPDQSTTQPPYWESTPEYRRTNSVDHSARVLLPEEHTTSLDSLVLQTGENSGSATAESGDLATLSPVERDPYELIPTSEYAFDPTQEQSGVTSPDSSTLDEHVEQEAGGTVDSLPEVSMGSTDLGSVQTDEVLTVTYDTGSSEASGVHEGMLDVTLLTSPKPITYSPPTQRSVEAEASSPGDFITFIPETSVPSGFDPLEEGLGKVEQEGLGEIPDVVETTTPETASGEEGSGDEQIGQEVSGEEESGQEASGDKESGQEASGDKESGQEASGDKESGQEASGDEESGQEVSGDEESGQEASGDKESGQEAVGDKESGQEASGDKESGQEAVGDKESGQEASGDKESGQEASGDEESGQEARGDEESGQEASGDKESGQEASGDKESGQEASGDEESGQEASGDEESGQEASGDKESGQEAVGDKESGQEASGDKESGQEAVGDKESGQEASGDKESGQEVSGQEGVESGSGEEHSASADSADSGESSRILEPEVPYINETVTPINGTTVNSTDESEPESSTDAPSTDMEITLLPDLYQTPVPSPTVPQESRADADLEYSGETSVTEDPVSITPPTEEPEETPSPTPTTEDYDDQTTTAAPLYPEDVDEEKLITTSTTPRFGNISDACLDNPCSNGGTCVDSGSSTKCLCLPTYGGDMCQTDLEVCEPGWEKFMGFCYQHFTKRQGWEVAEQHCRLCGGHLISVMTPEEQDYINDKYREYQWTGLNDRTIEGDFRWSDGNPLLYENWYRGQPDSYFLSGEDCVVMVWHDGGRWSDVPCNYHLSYTCKKGTSFCGQPPIIANAKVFGKSHLRYETNSKVRYYCEEGFLQTQNPVIKCLSNGQWEEALITCHPALTNLAEGEQKVTTPPYQNEGVEVVDTATEKATSEFWDIKWN